MHKVFARTTRREEACPRDADLVTVAICPLGETRTHMPVRAAHFECAAYAISPQGGDPSQEMRIIVRAFP